MSASKLFLAVAALATLSTSTVAQLTTSATPPASSPPARWTIEVKPPRIDEGQMDKIQPGMTRDDVLSLIGSPDRRAPFPRSATLAWDYDFTDTWGYGAVFSVIFDDSRMVVSKVNTRRPY